MIRSGWLPSGKIAAVCLSVDDIHPGTSSDLYEAGGDLEQGALGLIQRLQRRHPELKLTLCVTPDWRLKSLVPDSLLWRHLPGVRDHVHWTRRHPPGHFRLDRFPSFVTFLNQLERCEVILHGLTHSHRGPNFAVEFQEESEAQCAAIVERGMQIFQSAGLRFVNGYVPPAWNAPRALLAALNRLGFGFLCSARDLNTSVTPNATTSMSGLQGASLLYPHLLEGGRLVHLTCNFQATSSTERALAILNLGGVLHIKAHIFKSGGGHVMLDGLDNDYYRYLDSLFLEIKARFGDRIWWPHLSEIGTRALRAA